MKRHRRFRRRNIKKQRPSNKVHSIAKSYHRKNKYLSGAKIGQCLTPNTKIFTMERVNMLDVDPFNLTNQRTVLDYTLGGLMNQTQLDFMKSQYIHWQLLYFEITFYIAQTDNLVSIKQQGGSLDTYSTTQVTDPATKPGIYIAHFNSEAMQVAYQNIAANDSNTIAAVRASQHFGKLNQRNKVIRRYFTPKSFYNTVSQMAPVLITSGLNSSFQGLPAAYAPHGLALFWPEASNYALAAGRTKLVLGYKIKSVIKCQDRQPYSAST
jgi:hypothetical protein